MDTQAIQRPSASGVPRLPLWATVLLSRVQRGLPIEQARQQSGSAVSQQTIHAYAERNPDWWQALMDAQDGAMKGEPVTAPEYARAREVDITDRFSELAMGAARFERDQIAAGRVVLEVGGRLGPSAAAPGLTIVNTGELTMIGYQLHQAASKPAPVIEVTPAPAHIPARVKPADAPTE